MNTIIDIKNGLSQIELTTTTTEDYDRVTNESLDILTAAEKYEVATATEPLFDAPVPIKPRKKSGKKTQGELDREIVEKFYAKQTPESFGMIWKRFYYGVHTYAYKFIGDWERAADVVQDTFQKAWEKRSMYDPLKSVYSTWLYTIARNCALTQIQVGQKDRTIDVDVNDVFYSTMTNMSDSYAVNDVTYYLVDEKSDITDNSYEDVQQKIYDASMGELEEMDPLFQQIMEMKNLHDMTLREIAEELSMTESRVKNIYYKNKEILADRIKEKYSDLYSIYREAKHDQDERELVYG